MTAIAIVADEARRDLDRYTLWLRTEADAEVAERFARAAIQTFQKLAQTPRLGPAQPSGQAALGELRKWRIDGFAKALMFYRPIEGGIEVLRVVHAAEDWWANLDLS